MNTKNDPVKPNEANPMPRRRWVFREIPVVGHPYVFSDLFRAVFALEDKRAVRKFSQDLKDFFGVSHVYFTGSGNAAFCVVLAALKTLSSKNEVILPCYTAPSLVVAIRQMGLMPVLCDVNLRDFNMDQGDLQRRLSANTLAVIGVHMFGIPWEGLKSFQQTLAPDVFLIEDSAQAFGAKIDNAFVGTFGHAGFYSFNRGKNLPTVEGGCIVVKDKGLAAKIEIEAARLKVPGVVYQFKNFLKLMAIAAAFNPFVYGALYSLIAPFKDMRIPGEIPLNGYAPWQAALGSSLLEKSSHIFKVRRENGEKLIARLRGCDGVIIPSLSETSEPVFNRFPLLVKDAGKVSVVASALEKAGIESSHLYLRPLHHIFDLGYKKEDFPNATYLAEHLLTLPVHPLVTERDIEMMTRVIKEATERR